LTAVFHQRCKGTVFKQFVRNVAKIKSTFGAILSTITRLEAVGAQLHDSVELVQDSERQTGKHIARWQTE
jgi:hypothetical protein